MLLFSTNSCAARARCSGEGGVQRKESCVLFFVPLAKEKECERRFVCSSRPFVFSFPRRSHSSPTSKGKKTEAKARAENVSRFPCSLRRLSLLAFASHGARRGTLPRELCRECVAFFSALKLIQPRSDIFFPFQNPSQPLSPLFSPLFQASATSQPSSVGFSRLFVTSTSGALVS